MNEKVIEIVKIDPRELFDPSGVNFETLSRLCPKLKLVVRGSKIKALGAEADILDFERRFRSLEEYVAKYGHISKEVLSQTFGVVGMTFEPSAPSEKSEDKDLILYGNNGNIVKARTANQRRLVEMFEENDLIFAVGPAGSGKTYTAIALAVRELKEKRVRRIILTRPAVEAGEKLGFLPGDMKEKLDPYLQPLYDALGDMIPSGKLQKFIEEGTIQIAPLAYMRGRTLDNAAVILDEAQNTTHSQIKMFLTRMGRNAKFIVTGDLTQVDLPKSSDSGLSMAVSRLESVDGIGVIKFGKGDIIRHPLVKQIVDALKE
jgi:phosphate starvation-inducible PhoH-like protein